MGEQYDGEERRSHIRAAQEEVAHLTPGELQMYLVHRIAELSHVMHNFERRMELTAKDYESLLGEEHVDEHKFLKRIMEDIEHKVHSKHHTHIETQIENRGWMRRAFFTALGALGLVGLGAIISKLGGG